MPSKKLVSRNHSCYSNLFLHSIFPKTTDIEIRDFFQLQKWKSTRITLFDGSNIDVSRYFHINFSHSTQLEHFKLFTNVLSTISSIQRMHFFFYVVCEFHTKSLHTICCAKFSVKVSFSLLLSLIFMILQLSFRFK